MVTVDDRAGCGVKEFIGNVRISSAVAPDVNASATEWMDSALCLQFDPAMFSPEKGASNVAAKRICHACDVAVQCLDYALTTNAKYGIYGGLSETERRNLTATPKDAA
jgi:WhiB family redox-sensing transcriptional regulator